MKFNIANVRALLKIMNGGLCHGAGGMEGPGTFCVQQAVSEALGRPNSEDQPTFCVADEIVGFGIMLNDQNWSSDRARAKGMRRLAVAELGSNKIKKVDFNDEVFDEFIKAHPEEKGDRYFDINTVIAHWARGSDSRLAEIAELGVGVLKRHNSPGCKYLRLCNLSAKKNVKRKKTTKLFREEQTFASRLAEEHRNCEIRSVSA